MKYLFLVISLFGLPVYSNTVQRLETQCIVRMIGFAASDRIMISARDLERSCACNANRKYQGLSTNNCPTFKTIKEWLSHSNMDRS